MFPPEMCSRIWGGQTYVATKKQLKSNLEIIPCTLSLITLKIILHWLYNTERTKERSPCSLYSKVENDTWMTIWIIINLVYWLYFKHFQEFMALVNWIYWISLQNNLLQTLQSRKQHFKQHLKVPPLTKLAVLYSSRIHVSFNQHQIKDSQIQLSIMNLKH